MNLSEDRGKEISPLQKAILASPFEVPLHREECCSNHSGRDMLVILVLWAWTRVQEIQPESKVDPTIPSVRESYLKSRNLEK